MAKIAVEPLTARLLAQGDGWTALDIVCTSGPRDRPFEEQHSSTSVAIVLGGTFQYRARQGRDVMTPGSLLLGNAGQCFECGHEHGTGDHCVSFSYTGEFFERLAADAGVPVARFNAQRLPPIRALSPLVAQASAALAGGAPGESWEAIGIRLAAQALQIDRGLPAERGDAEAAALSRVTRVVRMIEASPDAPHDLAGLAQEARLSPYHFLRTFENLTGVTPHQYLLRMRLRRAAVRIGNERARIVDIAFDCGFGDISNFNRTFRAEFGMSPRVYRAQMQA